MTGSAKRGLIADTNSAYLETHNLTYEFGATLKLCDIAIVPPMVWCNIKVIAWKPEEIWFIKLENLGKLFIRPIFAEPGKIMGMMYPHYLYCDIKAESMYM